MVREAVQCLGSKGEVVAGEGVDELRRYLLVGFAMEAFDSCLHDCVIHPLDLVIGQKLFGPG